LDETRITFFSFRAAKLHLDELVVVQGTDRFGDDGRTDPGRSDPENRIQLVAKTPEILALPLGEFHVGIVRFPVSCCRIGPSLWSFDEMHFDLPAGVETKWGGPHQNDPGRRPINLNTGGRGVLSFPRWRVLLGWCSLPLILHAGLVAPRG
jgi:hypothetical protein